MITRKASGHLAGPSAGTPLSGSIPTSAGEQPSRPSAEAAFTESPSGRVTTLPTSKGPATAGTIATIESGGAHRAGHVEVAGDVGELGADAGAAQHRADAAVGGTGG